MRALLLILLGGCLDTGVERVEATLAVRGADVAMPFEARDGWQVELLRAELAFGPLYLCSGAQAGDLCEVARGESLDSVLIDALDPETHDVATIDAVGGTTRSAMWNYGVTWEMTMEGPTPVGAGVRLGSSVVVEGIARREDEEVRFLGELPLAPGREGTVLVRAASLFAHDIREGDRLVVAVDPREWLAGVRFDELSGSRKLEEGSDAARSISNALISAGRARPSIVWEEPTE